MIVISVKVNEEKQQQQQQHQMPLNMENQSGISTNNSLIIHTTPNVASSSSSATIVAGVVQSGQIIGQQQQLAQPNNQSIQIPASLVAQMSSMQSQIQQQSMQNLPVPVQQQQQQPPSQLGSPYMTIMPQQYTNGSAIKMQAAVNNQVGGAGPAAVIAGPAKPTASASQPNTVYNVNNKYVFDFLIFF